LATLASRFVIQTALVGAVFLVPNTRPTAFIPDEMLAYQSLHIAETWRDIVKVIAACRAVDMRRQFVSYYPQPFSA
jgi:hypothetical protein